jgi:hypothetical protein
LENIEVQFTVVEEKELKTENSNGVLKALSQGKMIRDLLGFIVCGFHANN